MALLLTCRSGDVHSVILAAKRCDVVVFKSSSTELRIGVRALCLTAGRKENLFLEVEVPCLNSRKMQLLLDYKYE